MSIKDLNVWCLNHGFSESQDELVTDEELEASRDE